MGLITNEDNEPHLNGHLNAINKNDALKEHEYGHGGYYLGMTMIVYNTGAICYKYKCWKGMHLDNVLV